VYSIWCAQLWCTTAQSWSNNLPSYPPDNHHSSDVVCWRGGGSSILYYSAAILMQITTIYHSKEEILLKFCGNCDVVVDCYNSSSFWSLCLQNIVILWHSRCQTLILTIGAMWISVTWTVIGLWTWSDDGNTNLKSTTTAWQPLKVVILSKQDTLWAIYFNNHKLIAYHLSTVWVTDRWCRRDASLSTSTDRRS